MGYASQNPGVVPALNPAMDATQSITLPTGEMARRHPDCIFVGTTNLDLEGCRNLNQAWQDRCQLIIDLPEPTEEVLKARVKSMVNWDEVTIAKSLIWTALFPSIGVCRKSPASIV